MMARMNHIVNLTGDYRSTVYSAARKLLADGADTLETWRNGKLSMSGTVGECAKLDAKFQSNGRPSFQLVEHDRFDRHFGGQPAMEGVGAPVWPT